MAAKKSVKPQIFIQERILSVPEACKELGNMNDRVFRDKARKGIIKAYKQAGRWFVLYSDLIEYVKAGKTPD